MRGCPMNECYVRDVWSDCVCPVLNVFNKFVHHLWVEQPKSLRNTLSNHNNSLQIPGIDIICCET